MIRNILAAFGLAAIVAMVVMASPALGEDTCPIAAGPAPLVHYSVMPHDPEGDQRDIV